MTFHILVEKEDIIMQKIRNANKIKPAVVNGINP